MIKVILDTNVLISAARDPGKTCENAFNLVIQRHRPVWSAALKGAYEAMAEREKHASYKAGLLMLISELSRLSPETKTFPAPFKSTDEKDQFLLDLAIASEADFLVTGTIKHFPDGKYGVTCIMTPAQFLEVG